MTTIASHIRVATALAVAVFAVATALPAASAHVAETEVKIDNFAFAPHRVVVKAGTTVTWINEDDIPHILSSMTMAGLYDGSGDWAWHVGLPAKSGVGGGIVAIVPGKAAIAVFAPPLDEAGNSVKAQEVIEYVAQKLSYNLYSPSSVGLK